MPDARTYLRPYPGDALGERGEGRLVRADHGRHSRPASWRCGSGACTSAAACRGAQTSQWFECPCHGSKYNGVGEKRDGPAPRGLDRFPVEITSDNDVVIDTGIVVTGPPIGTNTTNQSQEGPSCI